MAAATFAHFVVAGRHSPARPSSLGWIGSKAGSRTDFCKKDANGYIDQAAAAGAVVATVQVGLLLNDIASTVAQASDEAEAVTFRPLTDDDEITLSVITSGTSFSAFVAPTAAMDGDLIGLARMTDGRYVWDTTGNDYARVVRVDVANGTITGVILEAKRLN